MSKNTDEIIKQGLEEIDLEIKNAEELRELGEYLARRLAMASSIKVPIAEKVYTLSLKRVYQDGKNLFLLAASDDYKAKLLKDKYAPALYTAEYNDLFTVEENCQTLLSTFLGHVTGNLQIEVLEDDDSTYRLDIKEE